MTTAEQAESWPTPRSEDSESAGNHPGATDSLTGAMVRWATPSASEDAAGWVDNQMKQNMLSHQIQNWPTAAARDGKGSMALGKRNRKTGALDEAAEQIYQSSPQGQQTERAGRSSSIPGQTFDQRSLDGMSSRVRSELEALNRLSTRAAIVALDRRKRELVARPITRSGWTRPAFRRQLNPRFVEWMMGWRPGWTSLEPLASGSLETESSPIPPPSPSGISGDVWPTPDTQNSRAGSKRAEAKGKHAMSLHHVVDEWAPTVPAPSPSRATRMLHYECGMEGTE